MTGKPAEADLEALIEALLGAGVELIVVGGAAAVLHGAPVTTQDLDIVPRRSPENASRLLAVLTELGAQIRDPGGRALRPTAELLQGSGQVNLLTDLGPLDVLFQLHDGRGYEDLIEHSIELVDQELRLRVIDLPTLIAIKSSTGRARDRLTVPVLLALQEERDD